MFIYVWTASHHSKIKCTKTWKKQFILLPSNSAMLDKPELKKLGKVYIKKPQKKPELSCRNVNGSIFEGNVAGTVQKCSSAAGPPQYSFGPKEVEH